MAAAVLFFFGRLMPYVGVNANADSLADGDSPMSVLFIGGPLLVLGAAVVALVNNPRAAWLAAGAVTSLIGPALWIVANAAKWVTEYNRDDYGEKASLQGGAVVNILAILVAATAGGIAAANHASWEGVSSARPAPARTVLALAFVTVPIAVLTEQDGWSVWDIPSGVLQFSALIWALVPVGVAATVALRGAAKGVLFAIGAGAGNLVVAIGMRQEVSYDEFSGRSPYEVPGSGLFLLGAIAVVAAGLVCLSQMGLLQGVRAQTSWQQGAAPGVVPAAPGSTDVARWAPDPFGRFEYRWFDGRTWTSSVSTAGVTAVDPPILPPPPPPPPPPS